MWWLEGVLQLFDKYLEKCLWPHIFEFCFNLTHGKKNCPNKCSKYVQPQILCFTHCHPGLSALLWLSETRNANERPFLRYETKQNNFLNFFFWYWGIDESVRKRVSMQTREDRVYKTAKFWGYVLNGWTFIKYIPPNFGVLYTLHNNSKKILWTKFLLLIAEFWAVQP